MLKGFVDVEGWGEVPGWPAGYVDRWIDTNKCTQQQQSPPGLSLKDALLHRKEDARSPRLGLFFLFDYLLLALQGLQVESMSRPRTFILVSFFALPLACCLGNLTQ